MASSSSSNPDKGKEINGEPPKEVEMEEVETQKDESNSDSEADSDSNSGPVGSPGFAAFLMAKLLEGLGPKKGSNDQDPKLDLMENLAKLRAISDLASIHRDPGTSRQTPSEGPKNMLEKLRAKMEEDLVSKPEVPDIAALLTAKMLADLGPNEGTSGQTPAGGLVEDMLAKMQAKMEDNLAPEPEGQGNDGQTGVAGLLEELSKIQERIRTSRRAALEGLVEELSKVQSIIEAGSKEYSQYLPLYKATLAGDWDSAKRFITVNKEALVAAINYHSETALYIAVEAGKSHVHFVEKLVEEMSEKEVEVQNDIGNTALAVAGMVGNTEAARILVRKNPRLPYILNKLKYLPVHEAGQYARKDTLVYLREVTDPGIEPCPYTGDTGFTHLVDVMIAEFYDVALDLVKDYPVLATMEVEGFDSPLTVMAKKASAFPSGSCFRFWERLIYSGLRVRLDDGRSDPNNGDIENPSKNPQAICLPCFRAVCEGFHYMLSEVMGLFAPHIKGKKVVHCQALQLVKCLCDAIRSSNKNATHIRCTLEPIIEAAINGIPEVVEEIVDALPIALWSRRKDHYIFQLAVVNRCEKVFNLIYQMGDHKNHMLTRRDSSGNNILHLAGKLAPPHKLNLVSGAALQMQREIQWYKEVEKFVTHAQRLKLNSSEKTPAMVFSEEHKELVKAGEKWMKDTATSCTIAAALIVTMVFAAAITVPGGVDQLSGIPIFYRRNGFKIFFISDAISLFTSTTSLLMFLTILTARYAEQDFLFTLPNRLIIGLVTLFISTTSMMIAFSATLYLVFGEGERWSIFPIVGLACLPVTSFVTLQFPLLLDVIASTYGPGIFGKQSNRRLY